MSIAIVVGPESLLADRAVSAMVAAMVQEEPSATHRSIEASDLEPGVLRDLTSPSLFGERRALILRDVQDLPAECADELKSYLTNPEPEVLLILVHKGGVKGKAILDAARKAHAKEIAAEAVKKDGDKIEFVRNEFAGSGRRIAPEAAKALVDAIGSDLRELASACSQLLADTQGPIDAAAVEKYYAGRIEASGFNVADAAVEGRAGEALATLRHALATGTDPVLVTSALASALRTLAKVGSAGRSARPFELAGQLGLAPWQVDKARRQLPGWSSNGIATAIAAVALADQAVKGAGADPVHALERAILTIVGARE